jgi:hypothetical protein
MFSETMQMRLGMLVALVLLSALAQAVVPAAWVGEDIGTVSKKPEPTQAVADPGWERLKAGMIGGFIGGGAGLVLGAAAGALKAGTGSDVDAGPAGSRISPVVAGVAVGAVVGGLGALLFPGTGHESGWSQGLRVPAVAVRSEPSLNESPALVFDLRLVSTKF